MNLECFGRYCNKIKIKKPYTKPIYIRKPGDAALFLLTIGLSGIAIFTIGNDILTFAKVIYSIVILEKIKIISFLASFLLFLLFF